MEEINEQEGWFSEGLNDEQVDKIMQYYDKDRDMYMCDLMYDGDTFDYNKTINKLGNK